MAAHGMTEEEYDKWFAEFMFETQSYRGMKKDYNISRDINSEVCSECGGKCCKKCGCHFSPDDFKEISFDFLKTEMEKGYISIDYVDGEMIFEPLGIYILRARNQGFPVVDTGYKRGTPCILLTEKGCKLDYEHRPAGGRLLIPVKNGGCYSNYDIEDCCYEWKPYQKILHELIEYFKDKEIPCSI